MLFSIYDFDLGLCVPNEQIYALASCEELTIFWLQVETWSRCSL